MTEFWNPHFGPRNLDRGICQRSVGRLVGRSVGRSECHPRNKVSCDLRSQQKWQRVFSQSGLLSDYQGHLSYRGLLCKHCGLLS